MLFYSCLVQVQIGWFLSVSITNSNAGPLNPVVTQSLVNPRSLDLNTENIALSTRVIDFETTTFEATTEPQFTENTKFVQTSKTSNPDNTTPSERDIRMSDSKKIASKFNSIKCFQYHDETGQLIVNSCLTENSGTETLIVVFGCLGVFLVIGSISYFVMLKRQNNDSGPGYSITATKVPEDAVDSVSEIVKQRLESSSGSVYDNDENK